VARFWRGSRALVAPRRARRKRIRLRVLRADKEREMRTPADALRHAKNKAAQGSIPAGATVASGKVRDWLRRLDLSA
jgi:hypothetical protein